MDLAWTSDPPCIGRGDISPYRPHHGSQMSPWAGCNGGPPTPLHHPFWRTHTHKRYRYTNQRCWLTNTAPLSTIQTFPKMSFLVFCNFHSFGINWIIFGFLWALSILGRCGTYSWQHILGVSWERALAPERAGGGASTGFHRVGYAPAAAVPYCSVQYTRWGCHPQQFVGPAPI